MKNGGQSLIGVTLGVFSVFIPPLLFKCVYKKKLFLKLPWFACFGSGAILSIIFNHNLPEATRILPFDWVTGSTFLSGIITTYIFTYFFSSDYHCCEMDEITEDNLECCNRDNSGISITSTFSNFNIARRSNRIVPRNPQPSVPNEHSTKHWVLPILIGDAFCNFSDGMLITSAFMLCGQVAGWLTTLAVVLHEVSHEIGDFAIILSSGMNYNKAILFNFLSASASYLGWFLINLLDHLDTTKKISVYFILYGSGVLTSLVMSVLPKYIKNEDLNTQRARIFIILFGIIITTIMFNFLPHCDAQHNHSEDNH